MKTYTAKTLDECLSLASKDKNTAIEDLTVLSKDEKQGFLGFGNSVSAMIYGPSDILDFVFAYLNTFFTNLAIHVEVTVGQDDTGLKAMLNAENNAILIGKAGQTLQSINTVVKAAVNAHFKRHINVLVDINNYKVDRYDKVIAMAKRIAKTVQRTKVAATLDPLPNDERKVIHQVLSEMSQIRTESVGEGSGRRLKIIYDERKA